MITQGNVIEKTLDEYGSAVTANDPRAKRYLTIKRIFDVISSLLLLLLIWPAFLLIAIAIKVDSDGPVLYRHRRIGQYGKVINIYKFRTMKPRAEEMVRYFTPEQMMEWKENFKLTNDPRVTRLGKLLRRYSLDELPQIYNIMKGQLSVVGPRPVVEDELEKYGGTKEKFLSVKPGLTGYWQAFDRSSCSYEKRMEMELYYIEKACVALDIKILLATVGAVFTCRGAK